jgi:hypothetical protein
MCESPSSLITSQRSVLVVVEENCALTSEGSLLLLKELEHDNNTQQQIRKISFSGNKLWKNQQQKIQIMLRLD